MIKKALLTSAILLFCKLIVLAQVITLQGKVTDKNTGEALPGISILSGNYGTSTNLKGEFVLIVQKAIAQQHGITARGIGYQTWKAVLSNTTYKIELKPDMRQLQAVMITGGAESIVQKAYRLIPANYPARRTTLTGQVQIVHSAQDSGVYKYFYRNNAFIQIQTDSYTKKGTPTTRLLYKYDTLARNPDAGLHVRWIGWYGGAAARDYVHVRAKFLSGDAKAFNYRVNGKEWLDGHRVYVVNYSANDNNDIAGTLYIDTASYAYLRIMHTRYHYKNLGSIDMDKITTLVDYKQSGHKWYLASVKANAVTRYGRFDINGGVDYTSLQIDTTGTKSFAYPDIIPGGSEDIRIAAHTDSSLFNSSLNPGSVAFTNVPVPAVDTLGTGLKHSSIFRAIRSYLTHNNFQYTTGIQQLANQFAGYQPALGKRIAGAGGYAFSTDNYLRVLSRKELFIRFDLLLNFGISSINASETTFGASYNFIFNKKGHPLYVSPSCGYGNTNLSYRKTDYYKQQSLVYGLKLGYEISPRVIAFVGAKYYDPQRVENNGLLLDNRRFATGAGFWFKTP